MSNVGYVREKLGVAVDSLVAGNEGIKARLRVALESFAYSPAEEFSWRRAAAVQRFDETSHQGQGESR